MSCLLPVARISATIERTQSAEHILREEVVVHGANLIRVAVASVAAQIALAYGKGTASKLDSCSGVTRQALASAARLPSYFRARSHLRHAAISVGSPFGIVAPEDMARIGEAGLVDQVIREPRHIFEALHHRAHVGLLGADGSRIGIGIGQRRVRIFAAARRRSVA